MTITAAGMAGARDFKRHRPVARIAARRDDIAEARAALLWDIDLSGAPFEEISRTLKSKDRWCVQERPLGIARY
jgi:hypothetical protein